MEIIRSVPYDIRDPRKFSKVEPEFINPGPQTIYIKAGKYNIGTIDNHYLSRDFQMCTGLLFKSKSSDKFGFFHAFPPPRSNLQHEDFKKLEPLRGGQLILIKGSISRPQLENLDSLKDKLSIELVGEIVVETKLKNIYKIATPHDVLFKPKENEIHILRKDTYKDILTFSAF